MKQAAPETPPEPEETEQSREEDLDVPSPVWQSGAPQRSRLLYAKFDARGTVIRSSAWYDTFLQKYYFSKGGPSIDAQCIGWVPLPED